MTPERVTTSWEREGEMFAGSACGDVCEVVEDRDEGRRKFVVNISQCVAKMRSRGVTIDTHTGSRWYSRRHGNSSSVIQSSGLGCYIYYISDTLAHPSQLKLPLPLVIISSAKDANTTRRVETRRSFRDLHRDLPNRKQTSVTTPRLIFSLKALPLPDLT